MFKYTFFILMALVAISCSRKQASLIDNSTFKEVKNVVIDRSNLKIGPCEPSICISPQNPDVILAGSVLDNVYTSTDGGWHWSKKIMKSPYGVYGDPVVKIDNSGNFYYAHLSNPSNMAYSSIDFLDRIVIQKSKDQGLTWSDGSFPKGDMKKDQDKHWLALDPTDGTILMSWTEFDKYGSKDGIDKSRILFSKSIDQGESWSDPVTISEMEGDCLDDDDTTEGAVPSVGIDGRYYIVWSYNNKIFLDVSNDKGKTWMAKDKVIMDQPGGWTYDIPGISRCNGMPMMKCDYSNSSGKGNLYMVWSDQRNGISDTDIWFSSSSDGGATWKNELRVNDDKSKKHQFMSWMDVDPITGYIFVVFYDRRNYSDNQTDVYLAFSTDQGKSFINKKISEKPFLPESSIFFGDYNDISAYNGRVRPIWTRLDESGLSVMTAIIDGLK